MKSREDELDDLVDNLLHIRTHREMREFLNGLLTPKELEIIPRRLKIVDMLKRGVPQHEISKELGVGVATVTRGSRELKKGRFQYV